MKDYYIIMTLNGNLRLKETLKDTDCLEQEIYAETKELAKEQFKAYKKELKENNLI